MVVKLIKLKYTVLKTALKFIMMYVKLKMISIILFVKYQCSETWVNLEAKMMG